MRHSRFCGKTPLMKNEIIFLKLGGSLITDKDKPFTPRLDKLHDLAREIRDVFQVHPEMDLILGHGSGSFGHTAAMKHGTREGVRTQEEWAGFSEVRYQAAELNRHVMRVLFESGIPAIPFPPSSMFVSRDRKVIHYEIMAMRKALEARLLPVVYGDATFDEARGGTILSTEDVFTFLLQVFSPSRILLAGIEAGVWADFPARTHLIREIHSSNFLRTQARISGSVSTDVTGGMKAKVEKMLGLIQDRPEISAQIFSAEPEGNLTRAVGGENVGTLLIS
jgi:isopentenyl phosphate kinase